MQTRHLEREPGYKPGNLVRGWHRQNSGELRVTETINAIKNNTSRPLRIDEQPTIVEIPSINPRDLSTNKISAQTLLPQLKTTVSAYQQKHITCFEICDAQRNTLELVEEVVQICLRETGVYPYYIVLEPLRYLSMLTHINTTGGYYFVINTDIRIQYAYAKELVSYDVMAVCED